MKKYSLLLISSLCFFALSPSLFSQVSKLENINLYPVDESGNRLSQFKRGQYIRIDWREVYNSKSITNQSFKDTLNVSLAYEANLFGKKIKHSLSLPLKYSGQSAKYIRDITNKKYDNGYLTDNVNQRVHTDFYIPVELPPGKIIVNVTNKSNLKTFKNISFKKTIDLK